MTSIASAKPWREINYFTERASASPQIKSPERHGRGTYDESEWNEALETARIEHPKRAAEYLLDLPLPGDYLGEGLEAFGESCTDFNDRV